MTIVKDLCPRILWLEGGELRQDGCTAEVINHYLELMRGRSGSKDKLSVLTGEKQEAVFDLTNVPDRRGSGDIRFTGIGYFSKDGHPKEYIHTGDSLKVRLYYKVNKPVSYPNFYFRILNGLGDKVATLGTFLSGHEIPTLYPGNGFIDVDIESLNIMPDRYYIDIYINSDHKIINDKSFLYDHLKYCATLDVEVSDLYNSGKVIDKWWGIIFLPCKWDFKGLNSSEESVTDI
jgi:hypothetical protein